VPPTRRQPPRSSPILHRPETTDTQLIARCRSGLRCPKRPAAVAASWNSLRCSHPSGDEVSARLPPSTWVIKHLQRHSTQSPHSPTDGFKRPPVGTRQKPAGRGSACVPLAGSRHIAVPRAHTPCSESSSSALGVTLVGHFRRRESLCWRVTGSDSRGSQRVVFFARMSYSRDLAPKGADEPCFVILAWPARFHHESVPGGGSSLDYHRRTSDGRWLSVAGGSDEVTSRELVSGSRGPRPVRPAAERAADRRRRELGARRPGGRVGGM
jgi:hypothetical protein